MLYKAELTTPIGRLAVVQREGAILRLCFSPALAPAEAREEETPLLACAKAQLTEYFAGERTAFCLPLAPEGTPFQQTVWKALLRIPYGQTRSYGQIAAEIGNPHGARAVGLANNRNPLPIFVPCHRVVGADGSLTGYAGGLAAKARLLSLEGGSQPGR